jgi:hypothetical protein
MTSEDVTPNAFFPKKWFLHFNFDEGLTFAYNDIENNWEKYREWYISKMGK